MFSLSNRLHAGEELSRKIPLEDRQNTIIFAIPKGGIPVAVSTAHQYNVPLKVLLCKKIYAPASTKIGIGTLLPDGNVLLNKDVISFLGITRHDINQCIKEATVAFAQYEQEFKIYIEVPDLNGKVAVIIDDGIASGFTVLGALNVIRQRNPKHVIVATPVCSSIAIEILKSCGVEFIYLKSSDSTAFLVDDFYLEFDEVSFEQAHACLASSIGG